MTDTLVETAAPRPAAAAPKGTRLGAVHLAVTDGRRALAVWRDLVGLTVQSEKPDEIVLGAAGGGPALIVLHPGAKRAVVPNTSGLYHVAIHVPTRHDLAIVIGR